MESEREWEGKGKQNRERKSEARALRWKEIARKTNDSHAKLILHICETFSKHCLIVHKRIGVPGASVRKNNNRELLRTRNDSKLILQRH